MILTGSEIERNVHLHRIEISPFNADMISTNTYDLTLGKQLLRYTDDVLDPAKEMSYEIINIPKEGFVIDSGSFLLGSTAEIIGSDYFVPIIHAKSGTARMGLFVHITADIIDIGFHGQSTLQLYATLPIRVFAGMPIAQVSFWVPKGEIVLYKGKYQNSNGPQASKTYKDFSCSTATLDHGTIYPEIPHAHLHISERPASGAHSH